MKNDPKDLSLLETVLQMLNGWLSFGSELEMDTWIWVGLPTVCRYYLVNSSQMEEVWLFQLWLLHGAWPSGGTPRLRGKGNMWCWPSAPARPPGQPFLQFILTTSAAWAGNPVFQWISVRVNMVFLHITLLLRGWPVSSMKLRAFHKCLTSQKLQRIAFNTLYLFF